MCIFQWLLYPNNNIRNPKKSYPRYESQSFTKGTAVAAPNAITPAPVAPAHRFHWRRGVPAGGVHCRCVSPRSLMLA